MIGKIVEWSWAAETGVNRGLCFFQEPVIDGSLCYIAVPGDPHMQVVLAERLTVVGDWLEDCSRNAPR